MEHTLSIPHEKLLEIKQLYDQWASKKNCTKNQFQSLLGSLLYITRCIRPARNFLNRMLHILRDHVHSNFIMLPHQFFRDLNWFRVFLHQFNGVTFYDKKLIHHEVNLDASLSGLGTCFGNMVYALPLPAGFMHLHFTQLEMLNVVISLKVWANKRIQINWDNLVVVEFLKSGITKDAFLAACARNVWLITAMYNIDIIVIHVTGVRNRVADLLSRWIVTWDPQYKLKQMLPDFCWTDTHINLTKLNYFYLNLSVLDFQIYHFLQPRWPLVLPRGYVRLSHLPSREHIHVCLRICVASWWQLGCIYHR